MTSRTLFARAVISLTIVFAASCASTQDPESAAASAEVPNTAGECPVMGTTSSHTTAGDMSNEDWWPNQLDRARTFSSTMLLQRAWSNWLALVNSIG